jgi:hypothetical protein
MHAGQLATNNEKLEQQVGALAICTNTFTYMEADSDRVYPESFSSTIFAGRRCRQSAI